MNQKTNVIKKGDYERYKIILPFRAITGKRKKQFLCSELEKLHPCFSDECTFDSVFKKIEKGGLSTEVLVMNKLKLAEYERKRSFTGLGFLLGGENRSKRFFVNEKIKLTFLLVFGIILISVAGMISGKMTASGLKVSAEEKNDFSKKKVSLEEITNENALNQKSLSETLFEAVAAANGTINNFEWNIEGFTENLKLELKGVYPEYLANVKDLKNEENKQKNLVAVYENEVPLIKLCYRQELDKQSFVADSHNNQTSDSDFNKKIRELLLDSGAVLKEESTSPYHIEFVYNSLSNYEKKNKNAPLQQLKKLFEELSKIIAANEKYVTSCSITKSSISDFRVGLSIGVKPIKVFSLNLISQNIDLFVIKPISDSPGKLAQVVESMPVLLTNKKQDSSDFFREKLGEIKRSDNTTLIFYKNKDGKIQTSLIKAEVQQ